MLSKLVILFAALLATAISATQVTKLVVDIAGGLGVGSCSAVVSFDDAPDVELHGCASDSSGVTVPTHFGDVTVKCDVNGGGPNGANQCLNQKWFVETDAVQQCTYRVATPHALFQIFAQAETDRKSVV